MRPMNDYGLAIDDVLSARAVAVRAQFRHRLTKGEELEGALAMELAALLNTQHRLGAGEIIDSEDRRSRQVDLVVANHYQPLQPPRGAAGVYIAEAARLSVEVKAHLQPSTLPSIADHAASVKVLRPRFLHTDEMPHEVTPVGFLRFYSSVPYVVFAFDSSKDTVAMLTALNAQPGMTREVSVGSTTTRFAAPVIDAVFVLNQGIYINRAIPISVDHGTHGDTTGPLEAWTQPDARERLQDPVFLEGLSVGSWTFHPKYDGDADAHSTLMRFAVWMDVMTPRTTRHIPPLPLYTAGWYTEHAHPRHDSIENVHSQVATWLK